MNITPTEIPEVLRIEPAVYGDSRGFFLEYFNDKLFKAQGLELPFVQLNHSRSSQGVLRGLHYQLRQPQGKLVQVIRGEVFDVAVDIRRGSPTFGKWAGELLSGENHRQLYVPPGFAHGFCVLSESVDFLYLCTEFYAPGDEYGIAWDDPQLGIEWPQGSFTLSEKDRRLPVLADATAQLPEYEA